MPTVSGISRGEKAGAEIGTPRPFSSTEGGIGAA